MAKNANSILARIGIGGFILLLIGAAAGIGIFSLLRKPQVKVEYSDIIRYVDTCATNLDSFVLIRKDSFEFYELRTGEEKVDKAKPKINYVRESTSEDSVMVQNYSIDYNWGLTKASISFDVRYKGEANVDNWEVTYQTDSVLLRQIIQEKTDIIIQPNIPDIVVPTPDIMFPSDKKKNIYGGTGGLTYTDKLFYSAGAYMTTKNDITFKAEKFINSQGGQIEVMLPLSKIFQR